MKALTVRQPWASLIALGVKTIETRSWSTSYRGPLAIHAGAKAEGLDAAWDAWGATPLRSEDIEATLHPHRQLTANPLPLGAVVAVVDLIDVVPIVDGSIGWTGDSDTPPAAVVIPWQGGARLIDDEAPFDTDVTDQLPFGDFAPGRFAWLLGNERPLDPPIPAKGKQGLWTWGNQ